MNRIIFSQYYDLHVFDILSGNEGHDLCFYI